MHGYGYGSDSIIHKMKLSDIIVLVSFTVCVKALHLDKRLTKVHASQNADGSCYAHKMAAGETCQFLMDKFSIKKNDIVNWNTNTFGWMGCDNGHPWAGDMVCVSKGTPPKPAANPQAVCGPQAPGAAFNTKCPLNACCSQYGFCGSTSEFCDKVDSPTGAPGTAGCISNCGYGKVHTDTRSDFKNIVYWIDTDTKLGSDPHLLDDGTYSAVHYSFVNINKDLSIDDSKFKASRFLSLKSKKVATFGGWAFSTSPSTYNIFRTAVSGSSTREKFATNLVNFLKTYNLDGIDLDWEYPGATDIPGIPAGNKNDGKNFLELLKSIKAKLPSGKTLSIAIPATSWYLKNYPIRDMQPYIDYQIFMTYDIQGIGSTGNYLQCHTNKTEVVEALKMLDKAGVEIGKTYGGLANYGRSYKLSSTSCTAVGCGFSGLGAQGPISNSPGVLADSEINDITGSTRKNKRWTDNAAQCDIMVYDKNYWVAWPKAGQRQSMQDFFHHAGLAGSALWVGNYFKH